MWADPYNAPTARVEDVPALESKFFLWRCWGGGARLWQAFWLVLVLGHAALAFLQFPDSWSSPSNRACTGPEWR